LRPLKNNLVIAQEAQKKTTESGIILASETSDTVKIGVVTHIGPEVESVAVGDKVMPNWSMAKALSLGAKQTAVISEDDILVILE